MCGPPFQQERLPPAFPLGIVAQVEQPWLAGNVFVESFHLDAVLEVNAAAVEVAAHEPEFRMVPIGGTAEQAHHDGVQAAISGDLLVGLERPPLMPCQHSDEAGREPLGELPEGGHSVIGEDPRGLVKAAVTRAGRGAAGDAVTGGVVFLAPGFAECLRLAHVAGFKLGGVDDAATYQVLDLELRHTVTRP